LSTDEDRGGIISFLEFSRALNRMKLEVDASTARQIFKQIDSNSNNGITLEDLRRALNWSLEDGEQGTEVAAFSFVERQEEKEMLEQENAKHKISTMIDALKRRMWRKGISPDTLVLEMDDDNSGTVTVSELIRGFHRMNIPTSDREGKELFKYLGGSAGNNLQVNILRQRLAWNQNEEEAWASNTAEKAPFSFVEREVNEREKARKDAQIKSAKIMIELKKRIRRKKLSVESLFMELDADNSGGVSWAEVADGFERLGIDLSRVESQEVFKSLAKTEKMSSNVQVEDMRRALTWGAEDDAAWNSEEERAREKREEDHFKQFHVVKNMETNTEKQKERAKKSAENLMKKLQRRIWNRHGSIETLMVAIDANGSGTLTISEFINGLRRMNFSLSRLEGQLLFKMLDVDGGASISIAELRSKLAWSDEDAAAWTAEEDHLKRFKFPATKIKNTNNQGPTPPSKLRTFRENEKEFAEAAEDEVHVLKAPNESQSSQKNPNSDQLVGLSETGSLTEVQRGVDRELSSRMGSSKKPNYNRALSGTSHSAVSTERTVYTSQSRSRTAKSTATVSNKPNYLRTLRPPGSSRSALSGRISIQSSRSVLSHGQNVGESSSREPTRRDITAIKLYGNFPGKGEDDDDFEVDGDDYEDDMVNVGQTKIQQSNLTVENSGENTKRNVEKRGRKRRRRVEKKYGNDLCLHIMSANNLAARSCPEAISENHHGHQRVFIVVGEHGFGWKEKRDDAEANGLAKSRSAMTSMVDGADSGHSPVWNEAVHLQLGGLKDPEVSFRVVDDSVKGGGMHVIGEGRILIPMKRFSAGSSNDGSGIIRCRLKSLNPSDTTSKGVLMVKWSRPKAMTSGSGKPPRRRKDEKPFQVTAPAGPLGLKLTSGFMGVGARVGGFEDYGNVLEASGVEIGMYLTGFDENRELGNFQFDDVERIVNLLSSMREGSAKKLFFSKRPSNEALEWGVLRAFGQRRDAAAILIQRSVRRRLRNRAGIHHDDIHRAVDGFDRGSDGDHDSDLPVTQGFSPIVLADTLPLHHVHHKDSEDQDNNIRGDTDLTKEDLATQLTHWAQFSATFNDMQGEDNGEEASENGTAYSGDESSSSDSDEALGGF
jgi:Ca2+-binding EF-hand superfamily protein